MKVASLLIACGLVLFSTLMIAAGTADLPLLPPHAQFGAEADGHGHTCGGEPCAGVARGFRAFSDRKLDGLGGNGRACADCHMATDHFQLSPADVEERFQRLQFQRARHRHAEDPLFRPIDAASAGGPISRHREPVSSSG